MRRWDNEASHLPSAARETIRGFPIEVRKELGKAVYDLQRGETLMPLSRPMTSIAPGAAELRIRDRNGIYRVFLSREGGARRSGFPCFCEEGSHDDVAGIEHRKKAIEGVAQ
jgi:Phage derived protein Gp49-like (DUF891)